MVNGLTTPSAHLTLMSRIPLDTPPPWGVRIGVLGETQVPEAVFCDGQSGFCTAAPAFCIGG